MEGSMWAAEPPQSTTTPLPYNPSEDEFASTRESENLFDDDITPIAEPLPQQSIPPQTPRDRAPSSRGRGSHRGGNLRSNFRGGTGSAGSSGKPPHVASSSSPGESAHLPQEVSATSGGAATADQPDAPPPAAGTSVQRSQATSSATGSKPALAVRGNRLQTGGVQKPKLSEDELTARLVAAALNNAKRENAHRLAEADEAQFLAREEKAKEKRREEMASRRAMDSEREKNRLRKLGSRGGREWDEGKDDSMLVGDAAAAGRGRGGGYRRGAHGAVAAARTDGAEQQQQQQQQQQHNSLYEDPGFRSQERARAGFDGRRGGRGRGRGRGGRGARGDRPSDFGSSSRSEASQSAGFIIDEDFPALAPVKPTGSASVGTTQGDLAATAPNAETLKSPTGEKTSWADQVEAGQSSNAPS